MTHSKPTAAMLRKVCRHPKDESIQARPGSASAAPTLVPDRLMPWAMPRSAVGSQLYTVLAQAGIAPASAAPNAKRNTSRERKPQAAPVRAVNQIGRAHV